GGLQPECLGPDSGLCLLRPASEARHGIGTRDLGRNRRWNSYRGFSNRQYAPAPARGRGSLEAGGGGARAGQLGALAMKLAPMEALAATEVPEGPEWQYEPKWDGFRAIAQRRNDEIEIFSKSGLPLGRYFPDMVASLRQLPAHRF